MTMVVAVGAVEAKTIASCSFGEGYTYFGDWQDVEVHENPAISEEWSWGKHTFQVTFVGDEGRVEDVVLTSEREFGNGPKPWTRSASDYEARVFQIWQEGPQRQVIVAWGPITEVYAFDTELKTARLVTQKTGLINTAGLYVGRCDEVGR